MINELSKGLLETYGKYISQDGISEVNGLLRKLGIYPFQLQL